jgi:hypothetical protein
MQIREEIAHQSLPHMPVRVDEARHYDHLRSVDDIGVLNVQHRLNVDDLSVVDQNIAGPEIAECRIERNDGAALDQEPPRGSRAVLKKFRPREAIHAFSACLAIPFAPSDVAETAVLSLICGLGQQNEVGAPRLRFCALLDTSLPLTGDGDRAVAGLTALGLASGRRGA